MENFSKERIRSDKPLDDSEVIAVREYVLKELLLLSRFWFDSGPPGDGNILTGASNAGQKSGKAGESGYVA